MRGVKKDGGKLPIGIVCQRQFPKAIAGVAECSKFGHDKYHETDVDWCNIHRVDNGVERYMNAMYRHMQDAGPELSGRCSETGIEHVKHAAWNALAMLELIQRQKNDD